MATGLDRVPAGASEEALVRALEENLWSFWSRFGRGHACVLHRDDAALYFDTPIQSLPYNAVLRFHGQSDSDSRISDIFDHYRTRGVPFMWILHPSATPGDLDERLRARGFEEAEVCPGMCADLAALPELPPVPQDIELHEATDSEIGSVLEMSAWRWGVPADARSHLRGIARAFEIGLPGSAVRCWVAWRQGRPVSKVILNLAEGVAGLHGVATKPEARGEGLATSLALEAFAAARHAGYEIGVLHSTSAAYRLYERIGFRAIAPFRVFAAPDSFHL